MLTARIFLLFFRYPKKLAYTDHSSDTTNTFTNKSKTRDMFSKVYLILLGFVATVGLVAARPAQDSDPAKGIYNYDLHKLKTVKTTPTNDLAKETTMAFHGKPHAGVDIQCGYCSGCFASSQKTGNDYKAPGSCLKSILDIYESQDKWVNTTALVYTRGENCELFMQCVRICASNVILVAD